MLASPMMMFLILLEVGTIACFLNRPFVVCCTFYPLLFGLGNITLCISRIFLFGRARKASLILRMLAVELVVWVYDMGEDKELLHLIECVSWHFFELSICSLEGQGKMGGGIFLIVDVLG